MTDERTVSYRLERLEKEVQDFSLRAEGWHNALASGMTAIQTQVTASQLSMPDHYAPRKEANERHEAITQHFASLERRIDDVGKRIDSMEGRFWAILSGLVLVGVSAIIGLLRTIPPVHP
jgi:chromosome segregation ATPase